MGELSFAGDWVIMPFGGFISSGVLTLGGNPDIWFEVVPGTILHAAIDGYATVGKNPDAITPEGTVFPSQDWEIHIEFGADGNGGYRYWVEYDHVVDVLIESGTHVVAGQPLARGAPASIRHGGPSGLNPVEEFEWGLRISNEPAICTFPFLVADAQADILRAIEQMTALGFTTGDGPCLLESVGG
jgi:hypothetical protein